MIIHIFFSKKHFFDCSSHKKEKEEKRTEKNTIWVWITSCRYQMYYFANPPHHFHFRVILFVLSRACTAQRH